jgi:hypothetical protein
MGLHVDYSGLGFKPSKHFNFLLPYHDAIGMLSELSGTKTSMLILMMAGNMLAALHKSSYKDWNEQGPVQPLTGVDQEHGQCFCICCLLGYDIAKQSYCREPMRLCALHIQVFIPDACQSWQASGRKGIAPPGCEQQADLQEEVRIAHTAVVFCFIVYVHHKVLLVTHCGTA